MQIRDQQHYNEMQEYLRQHSLREAPVLRRLRLETERDPAAAMMVAPEQGQFIAFLAKLCDARRSLDIGVFTGYSALCVALAMPSDSYTLACDVNPHWTQIARQYWAQAGVLKKIDLRLAPAMDTLNEALQRGEAGSYDLAFIDADKDNCEAYYELCLQLVRCGGLVLIDNVLFYGSVLDSNYLSRALHTPEAEPSIEALRSFNIKLRDDSRVDISMLSVGDGMTLARKR